MRERMTEMEYGMTRIQHTLSSHAHDIAAANMLKSRMDELTVSVDYFKSAATNEINGLIDRVEKSGARLD